jgi:hypothetical protein
MKRTITMIVVVVAVLFFVSLTARSEPPVAAAAFKNMTYQAQASGNQEIEAFNLNIMGRDSSGQAGDEAAWLYFGRCGGDGLCMNGWGDVPASYIRKSTEFVNMDIPDICSVMPLSCWDTFTGEPVDCQCPAPISAVIRSTNLWLNDQVGTARSWYRIGRLPVYKWQQSGQTRSHSAEVVSGNLAGLEIPLRNPNPSDASFSSFNGVTIQITFDLNE